MKFFIGLLALSFSLAGLASSGETKTFTYDGSQESVELLLRGEKTHTEYKVEDVPSTCYRQEIAGYTTVCTGGYGPGYGYPRPYPGPYYPGPYNPRPFPRSCFQEPIYRSVPYSCMQTVRTPFEVKDFDVDTKVTLNVVKSSEMAASETITVTLNGDQLTLIMNGSKKFIGVVKSESVKPQMAGSVKVIDASYGIELVEADAVVAALKLTKISLYNNVLTVNAGPAAGRGDISVALTVIKKKTFGDDVTLLDRTLKQGEVVVRSENAGSMVDVNIPALGLDLKGGKFSIAAKLFFNGGRVLNRSELPELEATRTLIYKN